MKTLNQEINLSIFDEFALSNEEMLTVRGGDAGEPIVYPPLPPIRP